MAENSWLFRNRGYYDPLIAEPRAPQVHVLALGRSDEVPFVTKPGARRVWDIFLGKDIQGFVPNPLYLDSFNFYGMSRAST